MWAMRSLVNLPPRVRGAYALQVVGRMKPGVSIEAAESELGAVAAHGRQIRLTGDLQIDVVEVPAHFSYLGRV